LHDNLLRAEVDSEERKGEGRVKEEGKKEGKKERKREGAVVLARLVKEDPPMQSRGKQAP
jgi:hypothetical protein